MKTVKSRTPEAVAVEFGEIPAHTSDTMCRILIGCVDRIFQDPAVKADYKRWQQERQQKAKGATT